MDAVKEVAEQNNERIRVTESRALLYEVQNRFAPRLQLVGPGQPLRLFVKEGLAKKAHARGGAVSAATLILLSDQLLYAKKTKSGPLELHRRVLLEDPATEFQDAPGAGR